MRRIFPALVLAAVLSASTAHGQTAADSAAIVETALNYIEGWYEGDGDRMRSALHPQLAKRIVQTNPETGVSELGDMNAATLIGATQRAFGTQTPAERQQKDVTILDIYRSAAVVKIVAADWIDYLQVGKFNGEWVIINVLWEMKPRG